MKIVGRTICNVDEKPAAAVCRVIRQRTGT